MIWPFKWTLSTCTYTWPICFSKFYWMKFANLLEICLWLHLAVKGLMVCDHKPAIIFFGFIALKTEILTSAIVLAEKLVKRYSFRCLLAKKCLFPVSLTTLQYDWQCNSNYHISSGSSGLITAKLSYLQFSLFYKAEEDKYDSNISISFFCYICRFLLFYWISFPLVSDDYASFRWLFSSNKELGFFLIFSSDRHPLCHVFRRPWLVLSKTSHWPTLKIAKDDVVRELPNGKCWK